MATRKNEKYIITDFEFPGPKPGKEEAAKMAEWVTGVVWLSDKPVEAGNYTLMSSWYLKPSPGGRGLEAHTHDFPELLGFIGSDPQKPSDLCGEIEFWLEDEKYTLTKSCFIWVPKGMKHCPLIIKRVDKPIFHLGSSVKADAKNSS